MQGERTPQFANFPILFQRFPAWWRASWKEWKLMYRAVRPENCPTCSSNMTKNLREPLASIEWLVVLAVRMTELRVEFVQPHEIGVVGSRQQEFAAGPSDSVHLGERTLDIG